ncbi:hypothetical protein [Microbacterium trichothecenolyticum]|uniref:Uncharacterized protein n=1 Tax=Microbacterium trichothecenolyticum TaxID=69370 RepID=A0ABU0TYR8_MICTR|nr:hypothetical protein [Microbacterium trichothecenolyticum]MDQ1124807.1 hypothetical protein [Microbacterium trichothecenolyticum]
MIYGQQGAPDNGERAGSVWSIAMSTAMGNGIVPRAAEEQPPKRLASSWSWSRMRRTGEAMAVTPRT